MTTTPTTAPGLGPCPHWMRQRGRGTLLVCGCRASTCAICGHAKHSAVHMHPADAPGAGPFDHHYVPRRHGGCNA
jgi:hypothetical protein